MPGRDSALLEDQQRGDRFNAIMPGQFLVGIDIDLGDLVILGQAFDNRLHGPAGRAPRGPEVDEDRLVGLEHFFFPVEFLQKHGRPPWMVVLWDVGYGHFTQRFCEKRRIGRSHRIPPAALAAAPFANVDARLHLITVTRCAFCRWPSAPFCPPLARVRRQIRYATFGAQAAGAARLCPSMTAYVRLWPPELARAKQCFWRPGGFLSAVGQRLFRSPRSPREATVFFVFSRFGKFTTTGRTLAALVTAAPFCPPLARVRRQIRYATFGAQAT